MFRLFNDVKSAVSNSSRQIVSALSEQKNAVPPLIESVKTHSSLQFLRNQISTIHKIDILPVLVASSVDTLARSMREQCTDEEASWVSWNTLLITGVLAFQAGIFIYKQRKKIENKIHTTIVTLEAVKSMNKLKKKRKICKEQNCSTLRYVKGTFREIISCLSTEIFIVGVSYIPYVGPVSVVLSIYNRGRFILTLISPDLCERHQSIYLQEYPELALSLGITQTLLGVGTIRVLEFLSENLETMMGYWINPTLASISSMPVLYYETMVLQLAFLTTLCLAAHMKLPDPVVNVNRSFIDPLNVVQNVSGITFDFVVLNVKKHIGPLIGYLIKQPPSTIPWGWIIDKTVSTYQHPISEGIKFIILPKMLREYNVFLKDPIVEPAWEDVRQGLCDIMSQIQEKEKAYHFRIKLATIWPNLTALGYKHFFGGSQVLAAMLLSLIKDPTFRKYFDSIYKTLQASAPHKIHHVEWDKNSLTISSVAPNLPNIKKDSKKVESSISEEARRVTSFHPITPIKKQGNAINVEAHQHKFFHPISIPPQNSNKKTITVPTISYS